jgi:hypothetical protein
LEICTFFNSGSGEFVDPTHNCSFACEDDYPGCSTIASVGTEECDVGGF